MRKRSRLGLVRGYEESFTNSKGPQAVDLYCAVAKKYGVTPTQLAIALCHSRSFVTSTIIGMEPQTELGASEPLLLESLVVMVVEVMVVVVLMLLLLTSRA